MTHKNWRDAVRAISQLTGAVTSEQRSLAKFAGISLPRALPAVIAGARLENALSSALRRDGSLPSTDAQQELLEHLSRRADIPVPQIVSYREAEAWIRHLWLSIRRAALESLRLETGDIVTIPEAEGDLLYEVSSIGDDGCVYFRGGMGRRAWPDRLMVISTATDTGKDARDARRNAANQAAARARRNYWSLAKQAELEQFEITQPLTREDVDILALTIDSAKDEKPIQALVEHRPQLLTALLGGATRFCIPRARLGSKYVTDFLISDVDSSGIRWVLVELETPRSAVTLDRRNDLDKAARQGVAQVNDWREWLESNLAPAQRPKDDDGLGLSDIRPNSDALVIVGRRELLRRNSRAVRARVREESRIGVRTYDWWLEQLEGTLAYGGLPASPYVLQRPDEGPEV